MKSRRVPGWVQDAIDRGWFRVEHKPDSPPCLDTLLTTASEVVRGLAFLHSKDILHSDLSSSNVLTLLSASSRLGLTFDLLPSEPWTAKGHLDAKCCV